MEFEKYQEHSQWVFSHITKLESGCWQWTGAANKPGIHRIVADLCGMRYPVGVAVYHMPECVLGDACVNPEHVGTREEWNRVVKQELASRSSKDTTGVFASKRYPESWNVPFDPLITTRAGRTWRIPGGIMTQRDHAFLKELKVLWDGDYRDEHC